MLGEGEHAGRVKVLHFGLAKLARAPLAATSATTMPTAASSQKSHDFLGRLDPHLTRAKLFVYKTNRLIN
jgi:hypothetical protein